MITEHADRPHTRRKNDGLVGKFWRRLIGPNWKTTLAGLTYAIAQGFYLAPSSSPDVKYWAQVVSAIALGTALRVAKDTDK